MKQWMWLLIHAIPKNHVNKRGPIYASLNNALNAGPMNTNSKFIGHHSAFEIISKKCLRGKVYIETQQQTLSFGEMASNLCELSSHYDDVIVVTMASQITSLTIVYSTVCQGADQRKHQSSTSLAFVRGIHRWPMNAPHKGPVTRKMFPFDDVFMYILYIRRHAMLYGSNVLDTPNLPIFLFNSWRLRLENATFMILLLVWGRDGRLNSTVIC